ncbi:hypothetical protein J2X55_000816 [Microbacterium sp. 1154]|nr:hypothetical protein [Microbacterium sp. 1154]
MTDSLCDTARDEVKATGERSPSVHAAFTST